MHLKELKENNTNVSNVTNSRTPVVYEPQNDVFCSITV